MGKLTDEDIAAVLTKIKSSDQGVEEKLTETMVRFNNIIYELSDLANEMYTKDKAENIQNSLDDVIEKIKVLRFEVIEGGK